MENTPIEILKTAILMEKRGKAFYEKVAEQATDPDVKQIFTLMAEEEAGHVQQLSQQFAHYQQHQSFQKPEATTEDDRVVQIILNSDIKNKIAAAGFESAAISAAIDMENKAIEVYSRQAQQATDPNEKEMYQWLVQWEKSHHSVLLELNRELTEKIWYDNNFWPF